jgi:hypothetical protein
VPIFRLLLHRVLLGKLFYVGENLSDLAEMITSYRNHLKSVYEMEMFYGDETLQFLVEHTKSLHEVLENLKMFIRNSNTTREHRRAN